MHVCVSGVKKWKFSEILVYMLNEKPLSIAGSYNICNALKIFRYFQ